VEGLEHQAVPTLQDSYREKRWLPQHGVQHMWQVVLLVLYEQQATA
jgi:hypothetical protein